MTTQNTEKDLMTSNKTNLNDKQMAVVIFAFITMLLAFASTFLSVGVGCFLMFVFFIGNGILITLAFDLLKALN
jgi:hypothetical protein